MYNIQNYLPIISYRPEYNTFPNIIDYGTVNPVVQTNICEYIIEFYLTKETLVDTELFRSFITNAITRFRRSKYYKDYKSYLMSIGLNRSQTLGNITDDMTDLEMHHVILTIYDIAIMITEHIINTVGRISSFDLIQLLILAHQNNWVPIVFLDETSHELFHSDIESFLPPTMVFAKWWQLLYEFRFGITLDIARKVMLYINRYYKENDVMMVQLREDILVFAENNEYATDYYDFG